VNNTLVMDLTAYISVENNNLVSYIIGRWRLSRELAQDILQDAYESCLRYSESYTRSGGIRPYIFAVIKKMVAEFFRSNNPHSYKKEVAYEELTGNEAAQEVSDEETVLSQEPKVLFAELTAFIALRLPTRQRTVAQEYIEEYLSSANPEIDTVATRLNVTNTNVNSVWNIVTRKIRRSFGKRRTKMGI
jgi:RNA polymerase sigma factor (sigma-70 family)